MEKVVEMIMEAMATMKTIVMWWKKARQAARREAAH